MRFASVVSIVQELEPTVLNLCQQAEAQLDGARPDLVLAFITSHFEDDAAKLVQALVRRYPSALLLGCSAEGVIGEGQEHERVPALSLMLASLPNVQLTPFHVPKADMAKLNDAPSMIRAIGASPSDNPSFLFFGDPFTVPINTVLDLFNAGYPGRPVFGGMASGCEGPGQTVLILDDAVHREGAVGVALSGAVEITAVVSQGCRPIGDALVITACDRHVIKELGGKPALERLRATVRGLSPEETQLAREALFVGRVINEYKDKFTRGDFLIRNLMGIDPRSGAIAVNDEMRVGATIQFHIRDRNTADEDLRHLLAPYHDAEAPAGMLLFSCNGRGLRMWPEPNHDAAVAREVCGPVPVTGFFAAGEIGPIAGRNFIHGHTASLALFRPAKELDAKPD